MKLNTFNTGHCGNESACVAAWTANPVEARLGTQIVRNNENKVGLLLVPDKTQNNVVCADCVWRCGSKRQPVRLTTFMGNCGRKSSPCYIGWTQGNAAAHNPKPKVLPNFTVAPPVNHNVAAPPVNDGMVAPPVDMVAAAPPLSTIMLRLHQSTITLSLPLSLMLR